MEIKVEALHVRNYFGYTGEGASAAFMKDYKNLSAADKEEIKVLLVAETAAGRADDKGNFIRYGN